MTINIHQHPPPACPLAEFLTFPGNTQLYARLWLRDAEIHPAAHWIIRERLEGWTVRVASAPAEVRAALAREAAPEGALQRQAQQDLKRWLIPSSTMPTGAAQSPPSEQVGGRWHPSTPRKSDLPIPAVKSMRSGQADGRSSHGQGRWGHKCRLGHVKHAARLQ
jgi:hypothetical protein